MNRGVARRTVFETRADVRCCLARVATLRGRHHARLLVDTTSADRARQTALDALASCGVLDAGANRGGVALTGTPHPTSGRTVVELP